MWKQEVPKNFLTRLVLTLVLIAQLLDNTLALSDKRLCADINCKEIISMGTGVISYRAGEEGMVSFKINSLIRIKSKGAGSNPSLWGIEVNGREGYAPKEYIRETKILISEKDLKFVVDVIPTKPNPILITSEKSEQEKTIEITTQPFNLTPVDSPDNPLKKSSNEKFSAETSPVASAVLSEILDGAKKLKLNSDGIAENINENDERLSESDYDGEDEDEGEQGEKSQKDQVVSDSKTMNVLRTSEQIKGVAQDVDNHHREEINDVENKDKNQQSTNSQDEPIVSKKALEEIKGVAQEVQDNLRGEINDIENKDKNQQSKNSQEESIATHSELNNDLKTREETKDVAQDVQGDLEEDINDGEDKDELQEDTNSQEKSIVSDSKPNNVLKTSEDIKGVPEEVSSKTKEMHQDDINEKIKSVSSDNNFIQNGEVLKAPEKSMKKTDHEIEHNKVKENHEDTKDPNEETATEKSNIEDLNNQEKFTTEKNQVNKKLDEKKIPSVGLQNRKYTEEEKNLKDYSSENSRHIFVENEESNTTLKGDISLINNKNDEKVIKQYSFNSTENSDNKEANSKIAKQEELSTNNETLNITATEHPINVKLKIKNHSEQLIDKRTETDNVHSLATKADDLNFYKENLRNEPVNTDSFTSSKADTKLESTSDNILHNKDSTHNTISKIPEEDLSEKKMDQKHLMETDINPKEIFSENLQRTANEIKENNTTNFSLDSADININRIDSVLDDTIYNPIDNNNVDTLNNPKEAQAEQAIDNRNSFPTETPYLPQSKENLKIDPINKELSTSSKIDENLKFSSDSLQNTEESILNRAPKTLEEVLSQAAIPVENINPTTFSNDGDVTLNTPTPSNYDYTYQELSTNKPPNEHSVKNVLGEQTTDSYNSIPITPIESKSLQKKDEHPNAPPSSLFATIMSTVNNMLPINKKSKQYEYNGDHELDRILFSKNKNGPNIAKIEEENNLHYCKNIGPNGDCPETENQEPSTGNFHHMSQKTILSPSLTLDTFHKTLASKILEISELLAFLIIAAAASLVFIFGYYCFCNSSREGALLLKLNQLESSLLASHKENAILKHNLMSTRQKLASIEDNSFGSNDMVVSLKKELEEELMEKARLQEQITVLQKELENAADAGIELNKIVSELLSNQTGDESIISSVEELQKQLNEQQNTILEINASLAEKSRENSELQLLIAEQNARYETELANLQRDNDELEHEKGNLLTRLEELKNDFDNDITAALEGKNFEIKRLQNEIVDLTHKVDNGHTKWQTSVAKIEALEECLKNVRKDPHVNITEVIDVAYVKAQLIEIQKKYKSLKEKLETELDSKKLAENQLEMVCAEVEKLKQDFNQSEKDKLEAQTRLEVLSNYFKDKENQLQKELSLKEAMWLQQQGETTTTVDRVTAMQEEIQSLKSQNDSLRAEIEAQVAAHKAQIGTLENRAHETWLAARQSDRRYEETRAEATALRRKLTVLAGGNVNEINNKSATGLTGLGDDLPQAPSPIHMESPGSPMLGRMPPPPFLPPPFMGPPPPFMGMPPPPPFVPTGEMRPAPLGRIMSPPPQRSGRFSPQHLDYEDYLNYEGNSSWHRHTYSPPPRTYRSLSPTDSRYNYGTEHDLMSTYDTETDFSPPPSPRESRRRGGNSTERIDSKTKISYDNSTKFNTSKKGPLSSGSEKSFNTPLHNENKIKKGNASLGGKSLV